MKYKVQRTHPLGKKLASVITRIYDGRQKAIDFAEKEFSSKRIWAGGYSTWGGISGVELDEKPDGWKCIDRKNSLYMPKVKNKEIYKKLDALPTVKHREITELIGWPELMMVGMSHYRFPGFSLTDQYVLLDIPDKIEQPIIDGMEEILSSEYKKLKDA